LSGRLKPIADWGSLAPQHPVDFYRQPLRDGWCFIAQLHFVQGLLAGRHGQDAISKRV
jgi:hypothetical protein